MIKTEITDFLDKKWISYKIKEHKEPAFTCEKAAEQRGVKLSQIVKCMVWQDQENNLYVMLIPWNATLKIKKLRHHMWWKLINLIDSNLLASEYNLIVWAISPIQFIWISKIIFDPTVFLENEVDISSWDPMAWIELLSKDLLSITEGEIFDIISKN